LGNQLLFFFSALGVFNGLLASLYLLFFNKKKRLPNYFLGVLVLLLTIRIGKSVYLIFNEENIRLFLQIGLSACFMIGVMLYYYLKASVNLVKVMPNTWKIHVAFLLLSIVSIGIYKPYAENVVFWADYFINFIYLVWGIYIFLSVFLLKHIFKKYFKEKKSCTTAELWLLVIYVANALIFIGYIVGRMRLYIIGTLTFSLVIYLLILFLLSKKNREGVFQDLPEKYGAKKINISEVEVLVTRLEKLMIEEKLYVNPSVKLNDIAQELELTTHQLSQLLNDNLNKSFALFINEYRVEEAKELLKNNHQFTLEAIGYEAGFSSKSSFYATFKKIAEVTPAQFKKQHS